MAATLPTCQIKVPGKIYNCLDLSNIRNGLSAKYELVNDIDCSSTRTWNNGKGFVPIMGFTGTLDGKGYSIRGLYINRSAESYVGIFGSTRGAVISNINIVDATVYGDSNVGTLIGTVARSNITKCTASGRVVLKDTTCLLSFCDSKSGGLIGSAQEGTVISQCSSAVDVTAYRRYQVGGLVGYLRGRGYTPQSRLLDSYSTGTVTGTGYKQGNLVGDADGALVERGYSSGYKKTVVGYNYASSIIRNSFWDKTRAGVSSSSYGGIGKTTAEMQTPSTFTSAGWTSPPWNFAQGSYPKIGTTSANSCTDSDGGYNYFVKGTRTYTNPISVDEDYCINTLLLVEFTCQNYTQTINCTNGCLNGACISVNTSCSGADITDQLKVSETKTYTFGNSSYQTTVIIVSGDSSQYAVVKFAVNDEITKSLSAGDSYTLVDGSTLKINSISFNGNVSSVTFCMYMNKGEFCRDTDGINVQLLGTTYGRSSYYGDYTSKDYCTSSTQVYEFYCNGTQRGGVYFNCPVGYTCNNGACAHSLNQTGSIYVMANPYTYNASVYIDNSYKGRVPITVSGLSIGGHPVGIYKSGYMPYNSTVTVSLGQTTYLNVTLVRI
jgi:hypothetical protein